MIALMKYYGKIFAGLPLEIRRIITSFDISGIAANIGQKLNLDRNEIAFLDNNLKLFLINIWTKPNNYPIEILPIGLNIEQRKTFYTEIHDKIIQPITQKIEKAGFNNNNVLFKNDNVQLTAYTINGHPTGNVSIKGEKINAQIPLKNKQYKMNLIACYAEKPLSDRYPEFMVVFGSNTEMRKFKKILLTAIGIGRFTAFSNGFSQWASKKSNTIEDTSNINTKNKFSYGQN
jgi:hypothetical protein